ncbi:MULTISPECIES: FAD-binding domain-containing protein [unclassified Lentimonas]|uniref:FAD-binding domain-containing protein n=1 Tax=unclassified Lentimonas TaxID=2630993 RepID=UPI00138A038A|nr:MULTISPECIES: FAD-binding domain-containing protein [unclassified Lentimonas]
MNTDSKLQARRMLEAFMPRAGVEYGRRRNIDYGPKNRMNVSGLSPWVRQRVIPEWELITEVLKHHTSGEASKFIDEVCWRTYWKGWLRLRPTVWDDYIAELAKDRDAMADHLRLQSVLAADSGIDCMDAWTRELIDTGYLHNHARMWYASIWIHTLHLPWSLGADFFMRHLLDGDPAVNTLSWRWVAGLHTQGKSYLATASNIQTYSNGRFFPQIPLATVPVEVSQSSGAPPADTLEPLMPLGEFSRVGVLLQEDDLSAIDWLGDRSGVVACAGCLPQQTYSQHGIEPSVFNFRHACMADALASKGAVYTQLLEVVEWARNHALDGLLIAEPPIGLWTHLLPELEDTLRREGIQLVVQRHWWDEHFYPHARAGFFRFKKAIPAAIDHLTS